MSSVRTVVRHALLLVLVGLGCRPAPEPEPPADIGLGPLPSPDGARERHGADPDPAEADDDPRERERASRAADFAGEDLRGNRDTDRWRIVETELAPCPAEAARAEPVSIPAGPMIAGCDEADRSVCAEVEHPARRIDVHAFSIDKTEVSQAAYARCLEAGRCTRPAGEFDPRAYCFHPAVAVTWQQANAYCRWHGKRLPTELEWEKAARGDDGRTYPWGDEVPTCARATFSACGGAVTRVGVTVDGASPYGVLDLAGNVREWLADAGPEGHQTRAIRGGGAADGAANLRASRRAWGDVEVSDGGLGFRCVR
jgi:formylglycine-generating enzyme required for sulfatase activity